MEQWQITRPLLVQFTRVLKLVLKVSKYNGFMSLGFFFILSSEKQTKKSLAKASAVSMVAKNIKCL